MKERRVQLPGEAEAEAEAEAFGVVKVGESNGTSFIRSWISSSCSFSRIPRVARVASRPHIYHTFSVIRTKFQCDSSCSVFDLLSVADLDLCACFLLIDNSLYWIGVDQGKHLAFW
ncbi:hypothetical protein RJT34_18482 [Clitoria ternatea]|uniref:Uncharacterized protein n=1 Tax=Clitoria ternatea TaxID=43366 RepID=A0AAN9JAW1_CLITE